MMDNGSDDHQYWGWIEPVGVGYQVALGFEFIQSKVTKERLKQLEVHDL